MPIKIFHCKERDQELPILEDEINHFEQEIYSKGMVIFNITSSVDAFEHKLIVIVHYGNKSASSSQFREIRDDINNKIGTRDDFIFNNKYPEEGSLEEKRKWIIDLLRILIAAKAGVGYFTLLVKQKEIDDPNILVYYKKANLKNLSDIDNKYEFIESKMKHDTDLEASLRDVFSSNASSEAADSFSEIAKIRRELSQHKEVWEQKQ